MFKRKTTIGDKSQFKLINRKKQNIREVVDLLGDREKRYVKESVKGIKNIKTCI